MIFFFFFSVSRLVNRCLTAFTFLKLCLLLDLINYLCLFSVWYVWINWGVMGWSDSRFATLILVEVLRDQRLRSFGRLDETVSMDKVFLSELLLWRRLLLGLGLLVIHWSWLKGGRLFERRSILLLNDPYFSILDSLRNFSGSGIRIVGQWLGTAPILRQKLVRINFRRFYMTAHSRGLLFGIFAEICQFFVAKHQVDALVEISGTTTWNWLCEGVTWNFNWCWSWIRMLCGSLGAVLVFRRWLIWLLVERSIVIFFILSMHLVGSLH